MERYGAGPILIHDYDPEWPSLFLQESARIRSALGDAVLSVEHVGSTAVPGLAAKPIIDLLVGVRSLDEVRATALDPMAELGYIYLPANERWLPGELMFRKGPPGPWTHHAHVMECTSPRWDEFILIRDYLRQHAAVADAYALLKTELASRFGEDIAGFREAKRPFLADLLRKARAERRTRSP
jgi:GrpB-like predicted nucleotidyltransferase (UPF0157 family)